MKKYLQPSVCSLQQVAQLQILEVRLEAQVVLGGVGHHGLAGSLHQAEALVAAPAAGVVVQCARRTGDTFADGAGRRQLTGAVLVSAAAAVQLLRECTKLVVLRTIQERLEMIQPERLRPAQRKEMR